MAKTVKLKGGKTADDLFAASVAGTKYPWDDWFKTDENGNGPILLLEKNEGDTVKDFDVEVDAMPAKIRTAARRRYKVVQIARRDADGQKLENGLMIRARNMTPAERTAEDELRAEEKEAAKARKASANGEQP